MEGHYQFDKEGLELAFKYFTCTTLTIRLAGITQINVSFRNLIFLLFLVFGFNREYPGIIRNCGM